MPLPVLTTVQMREWEQATWSSGQSEKQVIREVGKAVANLALSLTNTGDTILLLAGKGNNGADVLAAGDHLADRKVETLQVHDPAGQLPSLQQRLAGRPPLIVDGLFGIGLNRSLSADWIRFIETINAANLPVLAVDLPSGLNADTGEHWGAAVNARVTLTVGAPKAGLLAHTAWPVAGRIEVAAEVGLSPRPITTDLAWLCSGDFEYPPPRTVSGHKGTYGHLAIIAGSPGYHGAAVLAARGAQRAQPGLVTLHAQEQVYPIVAAQLQAVMVAPWQGDPKFPGPWTAILIGPGLAYPGLSDQLKLQVRLLWRDSPLPIIVDASALDWLPLESSPRNSIRVLTPHPGEAARLMRTTVDKVQANRPAAVRDISRRYGNAWVVLKGHQTIIGRSQGVLFVNSSGNPYLAQGGSGDLLSGFIAGLLAQPALRADVPKALCFAVWQHGTAADRLQSRRSGWVVEDLASELGA